MGTLFLHYFTAAAQQVHDDSFGDLVQLLYNYKLQCNPLNGSADSGSICLLDHYLAGPEWNEGLIRKNIWIIVEKNPHNGSFLRPSESFSRL